MKRSVFAYLPGLCWVSLIATVSMLLSHLAWFESHAISALTLAIVIGMAIGHFSQSAVRADMAAGIDFAKQTLLRAGIVLYGVRLTVQDIRQVGSTGILIDVLMLISTFALACWLGVRVLKLDKRLVLLIGAGSSVCGAAAIMAAAPVVKSRTEHLAVAVATVVIFGTLAMFGYPLLYHWGLPLNETHFGVFIGSTVHEVAQVVAAGRAISPEVADTAVIAKMVRVMLLAPLLLGLSLWQPHCDLSQENTLTRKITIPWFAFAFIVLIGFNSLQLLPINTVALLIKLDNILLTMAMAGLGLTTHSSVLHQAGCRPLLLALLLFIWLLIGGFLLNLAINQL